MRFGRCSSFGLGFALLCCTGLRLPKGRVKLKFQAFFMVLRMLKKRKIMRKTLYKLTFTIGLFFTTTLCLSQEFGSFRSIEAFMTLTPNELESKLKNEGYIYVSKEVIDASIIKTFKKTKEDFIVNYSFDGKQITAFQWSDKLNGGAYIVGGIQGNENYRVVESKTDDRLGIFYLESTLSDLDVVIYKTMAHMRKGEMSFNIFRNKAK